MNYSEFISEANGGLTIIGGSLCGGIIGILCLLGLWKIFTKMGEAGWKSLIPGYNYYILYKDVWTVNAFWVLLLAFALSIFVQSKSNGEASFLPWLMQLVITILNLVLNFKLAKAFGRSFWFGLGLTFISPLFLLILGFGGSRYLGAPARGDVL